MAVSEKIGSRWRWVVRNLVGWEIPFVISTVRQRWFAWRWCPVSAVAASGRGFFTRTWRRHLPRNGGIARLRWGSCAKQWSGTAVQKGVVRL